VSACAHAPKPVTSPVARADQPPEKPPLSPDRTIQLPPVIITSSKADADMSTMNDEELFAIGQNAMAAGDNKKALMHFERLADFHPASKHRPAALHFAGLMLERMKDYAGALGRFKEAMTAYGAVAAGADAQFKAADEYYFLGDLDAAAAELETLSHTTYLPATRQMEATTKRAIVLYNAGRIDEAEKILRLAVETMKENLKDDYRDGYLPSQAQFYIAEIFRARFLEVKLDPPNSTKEKLMSDLEYKAQMLLSAQGHYLRCIRVGHPEWATASGYRIGELYQGLYEQLMDAKPPNDLEPDAIPIYREELHAKLKNVVGKAVDAYEKTLATAERVGATNPFIGQTREQLEKMKNLLLQGPATATESTPKPADGNKPDRT
jgi:tetratricopeptide (TPR) repeat protein